MRVVVPPSVLESWQALADAAARLLTLRAALVVEAHADHAVVRVASGNAPACFEVDVPLPGALTLGPHEALHIEVGRLHFGSLLLLHEGDRRLSADELLHARQVLTLVREHVALLVRQRRDDVRVTDLREHEDRYQFAIEACRIGLWDFDASTGRLYCDARWHEIFGLDPASYQVTINTYEERVHPDDRVRALTERVTAFHRDLFEFTDHRIVTPAGEVRWIRASSRRILRSDGRAPRLIGVVQDITTQRRAQDELVHLGERVRLATEVAGIGIWEIDVVRDTFVTDEQMQRVYELGPTELTIAAWRRCVHPDDRKRLKQEWLDAFAGDGRFASEFRAEVPRGLRYIRSSAQVFFDAAHQPLRIVGTNVDVTAERVARTEAEAAAKSKSDFLANMSHEIRTPMNAVVAFAGMLVDTELTASQREMVRAIKIGADHLMSVLNDVLDLSRIMAGQVEIEARPFALRRCVEDCLDLVAAHAAEKDLSLTYSVGDDVPDAIVGDEPRLRQVLLNLLANAVKFTNCGAVTVTLAASGDDVLSCAVRDTGIGIPADRMNRLFQEFSQVDTSTRREFGGTGLGLAISRRLCELMDGSIRAESEPEQGSTFTFTFRAPPAPSIEGAQTTPLRHLPADLKVLVVDDSAPDRLLLTSALRSWGIEVEAFESPREALVALWQGRRFSLAVLDYRMPEMSGLELASELRRIPGAMAMPVVLISAYALHAPEVRATDVPIHGILTKPVRQSTLFDTLADCLIPKRGTMQEAPVQTVKPPIRILLVEDNLVNQRVALMMLERLGYAADVASSGLQGVELAIARGYDVVLMDIQMPDMDGLEATRRIRKHYGDKRGPRIVAMTAHALASDREMCLAAGMDGYISKPIDQHRLAVELSPPTTQRVPRPEATQQFHPSPSIVETLGEEGIREVVTMFVDTTPKALADMNRAVAAQDRKALALHAHSLRSVCQMLGALEMAATCNRIEYGKELDWLELGREVAQLAPQLEVARVGLLRFLVTRG